MKFMKQCKSQQILLTYYQYMSENHSNSQLSANRAPANGNRTCTSSELRQIGAIDSEQQPLTHTRSNTGAALEAAPLDEVLVSETQARLLESLLEGIIDGLIRQQAREAFVSEQIHVLHAFESGKNKQQPSIVRSSDVLESQVSSLYANQNQNFGENSGDNDNSFMRNVPEKEESAFSKEAVDPRRSAKQCSYVIVSAASAKTHPLPQPDSNQAVAEDEVEDSMSDEAGIQPYTQTQSLQLFAKQPHLYEKMSISQNNIENHGLEQQRQPQRGASGLRLHTANSTFVKLKKGKNTSNHIDMQQEMQDNSALNISDQISVNIKYDSFREEASKFKINSISNQGPIGTLAEPKKPKLHHQMMNLDRISVSERKALGVFGNDRDDDQNDDLRMQTNMLTNMYQLNQNGNELLSNPRSADGSQFELLREEAYKQLVDVKCNNCGIYLKFEEVDHHSQKCQQLRSQAKSTIQIYFQKKQDAKNDLSDINENILKIQEAIFARLGQIDQQYEEVLSLSKFHSDSRELSMVMKLSSYKQDTAREQNQLQNITITESDYSSKFKKVKTPNEDTPGPFSSFRNCAKSPVSVAQSPSVAYTEKAILENLNYFIDQFTNLHAVCNKALEVDESSEELQLVLNVLSQDLQQIEEAASQEQFSDAHFFPTRDSSLLPPNLTQENLDQVIVEQRHRQLINFAKRIMFCIMHKLNTLQSLERINEYIQEEKRRDPASRLGGLQQRGQILQAASTQDPRSQDNQLWRYQSVLSSSSNRPPSNRSQNAKLSARVRPKVRRTQNSDRGEGLDSFKISHSDIDRDFENILNDSKLLLTNQSGQQRQAERGPLAANDPRRPGSDSNLLQDCFFQFPMTPKQKKKGWRNPRVVSKAVLAIEINDRVDKGVVEINISHPKRQVPILESYVGKSHRDSRVTIGQSESQGPLQSEYLDQLLQLTSSEQNKEWSIGSRSPSSALERDCTYQLFQLQHLNLKEQTEALAKVSAGPTGSRRATMHNIQEATDLLSPVAVYQEKQFAQARTQQQAQTTPTRLKFERKTSCVTKPGKLDQSLNEAAPRLPEPESATAPLQASTEQAAGEEPPSASLRQKSVQDYKNTFKQFLRKKREGEPTNEGRGSALTREDQGSGAKTKDSGARRKSQERNQEDQKPDKAGKERRRPEPDLRSQILQDFGIAPKKNENSKQGAKRASFLLQSRQKDASGSGQKKSSPDGSKAQEKAPLHQGRKSKRAIPGFQSAGQRVETGLVEEVKTKSRTNKATPLQATKNSIPNRKLKNQEEKLAGAARDQRRPELRDAEKSPRLPQSKYASLSAMSPLVIKEGASSLMRPKQESSTAHKPREHPTGGNVSSVSPLPRRSRKINIADYGYSDQQLKQARNSVDRIMGGKVMKPFDVEAWRARQELRQQTHDQEEAVQLICQKKAVEEKVEVHEKQLEKQEESKIEEERQSELERSLLWDGLITLNQSSQLPTIQTENQLDSSEMHNSDAKSEPKTKEQDLKEAPNREPRKTNQSNDSQRSSVRSRKNLFAKKGRASVSSVDKSMTKGGNESLNEIEREISLLQSEAQSRRSHRQFLPQNTHSKQRSQSRKSEPRVPAIAGFEQALLRPYQGDRKPTNEDPKSGNTLEPPAELNASTSSKGSDRARRSRKINIDEYGYGEQQLRRAQRSVSQLSRASSSRANDNKKE